MNYKTVLYTNQSDGHTARFDDVVASDMMEVSAIALSHFHRTREPLNTKSTLDVIYRAEGVPERTTPIPVMEIIRWARSATGQTVVNEGDLGAIQELASTLR